MPAFAASTGRRRGRDIGALMELARAVNGMGTPAIAAARAARGRRPDEAADARRSGIGAARTAAAAAVRRRLLLFARRFLSRFSGCLGFPAGNLRDLVADALLLRLNGILLFFFLVLIAFQLVVQRLDFLLLCDQLVILGLQRALVLLLIGLVLFQRGLASSSFCLASL